MNTFIHHEDSTQYIHTYNTYIIHTYLYYLHLCI